ncbi:MFS transporter [Paenibacillus humicola]|uniref:MFS transporter n=1 Tax=Paenibacillus humicola TaxID=3110540 RepID=UPI00237AF239|nr:MFS transporter [Paenibacillus humicola]
MFQNRYVRTIVLSRIALQFGIWIRNFAVLLEVTEQTHNDPLYVSLISVAEYAPIFIFAFIGGTFADRWKPKRTMVWSDALSAVSVLAVWAVLLQGRWYTLLLGTFVSSSLSQFSQPSAMKLYKKHVPVKQLQGVMALSQSLTAIFMVAGPAIGTLIYAQAGIEASLLLTCVFFSASAVVLTMLPRDAEEGKGQEAESFMADLTSGIRYLWQNRALRILSVSFAAAGLAAGLIQPLAIFIVIEKLSQGRTFLQWMLMVNGAAMLLGGALITGIAKRVRPHVLLAAGLIASALCTVGVGASTRIPLTILLQAVSGLFYPCIQVGIQTMIMNNTKAAFMGPVGGAITPVFMGMMVSGMSLSGYFKDAFSLFAVYAASGSLLAIGALLLIPLILERSRMMDEKM